MSHLKFTFFILLLILSEGLLAQSPKALKEEAKAFILAEHYEDAIRTLQRSRTLERSDDEARFLLAVCHFQLNHLGQARQLFNALTAERKAPYPECWLYLAKIYHAQQEFSNAAAQYKLYLRTLRVDHPNRAMIIEEIRRCDNGLRLQFRDPFAIIENLGPQVNTAADEFAPVISPNLSSKLYFSTVRPGNSGGPRDRNTRPDEKFGHHLSDMFSTQLVGGQWQSAQPLHSLLNTPQHESLIGFTGHGNVLLYYQGWNWERGEIFADTFQQERSLTTIPFLSPANGRNGEQQLFVYYDTLLIFASRRAGGYGGLDLYQASFRNGRWSAPENMGPTINSPYDETTPFLARDGKTLYYSTNNSTISLGGLDIIRSVYLPDAGRWSKAENMGLPINSAADDSHFRLARDGFTGFFASARKDGLGQRDLYVAYFTKYRQEMEPPAVSFHAPQPINTPPDPPSPVNVQPVQPPTNTVVQAPASTDWSTTAGSLASLTAPNWFSELRTLAQRYPNDHLVISCYVPQSQAGVLSNKLYEAMMKLQNLSNDLQQNADWGNDRIFLRTLAHPSNSYLLTAHLAPQSSPLAQQSAPIIGLSAAKGQTVATDQVLCYKVQVAAVQRPYSNTDISSRANLMLEKAASSPYFRYTSGAFAQYTAANNFRRELIAAGHRGAYVVPYLYGKRLEKGDAEQYAREYPDLRFFLGR